MKSTGKLPGVCRERNTAHGQAVEKARLNL